MDIDPKAQQANADIGGYLLMKYGGLDGSSLRAANAVSALGALAGVFAQAQARAMLAAKSLPDNPSLRNLQSSSPTFSPPACNRTTGSGPTSEGSTPMCPGFGASIGQNGIPQSASAARSTSPQN